MLFNSFEFLIFLPLVVIVYFLLPWKWRWLFLLAASYYFYMSWSVKYLILILLSTATTFYTGLWMSREPDKKSKKKWLYLSLAINLGILFFFKYFNFFNDQIEATLQLFNFRWEAPELRILLPVGISFYTFQALSYTIDIYFGRTKAEKHLGIYALYVSFFPQLVMGPIERSNNLLPQFKKEFFVDYDRMVNGLNKIAYGFFKKLVVADRLKLYVDEVHANYHSVDGTAALVSAYFFAIQMYCDFSGYTDIAIGTSRLMGVELMENFKKPFLAKNMSDLWVRWHISLTTWFMDYIFVPLGGYTPSIAKTCFNLVVVSMITGLWHGANWTFIIAFSVMGVAMSARVIWIMGIRKWLRKRNIPSGPSMPAWLSIFIMFNVFCLNAVFIRSANVDVAFTLFGHMFSFGNWIVSIQNLVMKNGQFEFVLCMIAVFLLFLSYLVPFNLKLGKHNLTYLIVVFILIYFLGYDGSTDFFYFQF